MKNVWLQKIRRDNPREVKHFFVCSEHFTSDSYVTSLAETLCGHKGRRILEPDAVPTIFKQCENTPKPKPRLSSERRSHTRTRNEVNYICVIYRLTQFKPIIPYNITTYLYVELLFDGPDTFRVTNKFKSKGADLNILKIRGGGERYKYKTCKLFSYSV